MRKLTILIVSLFLISSCSKDENSQENPADSYLESNSEKQKESLQLTEISGKWKLTEMTGGFLNSETTGNDMEWQEFYLLNEDGTFTKSRERNGTTIEVSGLYNLESSSVDENLLRFTYNGESNIIGTCSSDLQEHVYFQSDIIFTSTWRYCDGPGLKYEKID